MSEIKAIIDQPLLDAALSKISTSGVHEATGSVPVPVLPDVHWSASIRYTVSGITGVIEAAYLRVAADVHVEGSAKALGVSVPVRWTGRVEATNELSIEKTDLVMRVTSLNVPVYFQLPKPIGHVDLGQVNVCKFLADPLVVKFRLLADTYSVSLPGGQSITLSPENPVLTLQPGVMSLTLSIGAS